MLGKNNLANYYKTIFTLVQHHKYSITEVESLIPYELDFYVEMLIKELKESNK